MGLGLHGYEHIVIVDPTTPEAVRGSFRYLPYLLWAAFKHNNRHVMLVEDFNAVNVDRLPRGEIYLVALWSHPQIEHVKLLLRSLPTGKVFVFGYSPLIEAHHMPCYTVESADVRAGMTHLSCMIEPKSHALMNDGDMHVKGYAGPVFPVFTSYGCPNKCAFCPATIAQPVRIVLDSSAVINMLSRLWAAGRTSIHFTDEDFFFDPERAHKILSFVAEDYSEKTFNFVALAARHSLLNYLEEYGGESLTQAGFRVIEVGLESGDKLLAKAMGKKGGSEAAEELAEICPIPIIWLTLTFFPGETIQTLHATGAFMASHGLQPEDLCNNRSDNGTLGGLGQFFVPYEGTKSFTDLAGIRTIDRPIRLLPGFIPFSFLRSKPVSQRSVAQDDLFWYQAYNVHPLESDKSILGKTVQQIIGMQKQWATFEEACISLAISARIGVIK